MRYGTPPTFKDLCWPNSMKKMDGGSPAHWVFADFLDCCKIPVICQIVSLINSGDISGKNFFDFAWDLFEADWH